jgi:hypothetical protein
VDHLEGLMEDLRVVDHLELEEDPLAQKVDRRMLPPS